MLNETIYVTVVNGHVLETATERRSIRPRRTTSPRSPKGRRQIRLRPMSSLRRLRRRRVSRNVQTGIEVEIGVAAAERGGSLVRSLLHVDGALFRRGCRRNALLSRSDVGLVGMHLDHLHAVRALGDLVDLRAGRQHFTMRQVANRIEDANGALIPNPKQVVVPPTGPALSLDPSLSRHRP